MRPLSIPLTALVLGAVFAHRGLPATDDTETIRRLEAELRAAPGHGGLLFRLARERALAGDAEGALRDLQAAVATGLDLDIESESAFRLFSHRPEFMALLDRALDQRVVARSSTVAFRVAEPDLIPEGLAHDPVSGDFFLGSVHKRKVVRIGADGKARDFTASGQDGLWDVLGMKVDARRRLLWVLTAAGETAGPQQGWSAAFVYDLSTGRLLRRHSLYEATGKHLLNDLVLAADGRAFLTDSEADVVWRIDPGQEKPVPLVPPGRVDYPNGIALSGDERLLYVADFASGISIVDPASGSVGPLPHPPNLSLHGLDGLYWHPSGLIAIQNGAGTERIVRYRLAPDGRSAVGLDVLESRNPLFAIPTTGAIVGSDIYYIANSLLDRLGPDGRLKPGARLEEVVILKAPLGR